MSNQLLRPHGRFFPLDKNGYIINDTDWSTIPTHWQLVIEDIIKIYKKHLSDNLIAIYVRGSVARNLAFDGFSDIDTFALIKSKRFIKWEQAPFRATATNFLQQKYAFVKEVEIQLVSYQINTFLTFNPKVAMLIQTQSLCVFGTDIIPTLPKYLPNRNICLNHHWLEEDITNYLAQPIEELTIVDHRAILKIIIRSGFELVIEQEQQFTLDLYLCYKVFSKHYPSKSVDMRQALLWYITPNVENDIIRAFVNIFGQWLITTSKKIFG